MSALRFNRQQMTEAIMLFNDDGIVTEMLYPEFEAVLDNVVSMPRWADQQVKAAYVVINPRLQVRSVALFYLDFDEKGAADAGWNIPLRQLIEKAEYGPDLGGGPIRLVSSNQCPIPWLQMHLWDADLSLESNHLHLIREAVQRNQLRLLVEDEPPPALELDRLQMAAEEAWQLPGELEQQKEQERRAAERDKEQRKQAARIIKRQRKLIRTLESEHNEALSALRKHGEQQLAASQQGLQQQEQQLLALREQNQRLRAQVDELRTAADQGRVQLDRLATQEQVQAEQLHEQFARQLETDRKLLTAECEQRMAALCEDYESQLSMMRSELQEAYQERENQELEYREGLRASRTALERLDEAGVALVTVQPGAGHMTIPVVEVDEYLRNPKAYAARHCMVSEEEYLFWLRHYEKPVCDAVLPVTGAPCGLPLERKTHPERFTPGISNRCSRHRELWKE